MNVTKGLDPRARTMLSERSEVWLMDTFGFQRQRQSDQRKAGYETKSAYQKRTGRLYPGDLISWSWLRKAGLLDSDSGAEASTGLALLKEYLELLAQNLGEVSPPSVSMVGPVNPHSSIPKAK
jgi:hypothetical protein